MSFRTAALLLFLFSVPTTASEKVEGWNVGCRVDRLTLARECYASKGSVKGGNLRVSHTEALGFCFTGPWNDFPGRQATIRIGDNEAISYDGWTVCGQVADQLIKQLKSEQSGAARGFIWPKRIDEYDFTARGFRAALAALNEQIKKPHD